MTGMDALPFVDCIEADQIDLMLITHFHLDHAGALPWFLQKTTFRGKCFMTHATKAIFFWLLSDYIKVSNIATDQMLYTDSDLEAAMDKIETINFHEEKEVSGIKFWCYNAGHVLGAAMFMLEIAGVKILYTGDFSREEDRHLPQAEIPNMRPDVLICESTYGQRTHDKREDRESRFTSTVESIVTRGGRCLIPVFALGRAQELLLILDEYWAAHPELTDIPIYFASSLAKKCMAVYQTFINSMNERIRRQIAVNNPFVFKHISNLKGIDHFDDVGPCVVLGQEERLHRGGLLRGGHPGQAHPVRPPGDHRHERPEAAPQPSGGVHQLLRAHGLQADLGLHPRAQAAARGAGPRRGERDEPPQGRAHPRVRERPRPQHRDPQPAQHRVRGALLPRREDGQGDGQSRRPEARGGRARVGDPGQEEL